MTPIGWFILGVCILIGIGIGSVIYKRHPNIFNRDKKIKEVIENPQLLVEKLKSSGKIYDGGNELNIKVGKDSKTGQDVVVVEEIKSKRAEKIQKKIATKTEKKKPKPKKAIKKKKKK